MPYVIRVTDQKPVAVATLDDARDAILAALDLPADADLAVQEPRADGSMTITLPDGEIEVEPTTWRELAAATEPAGRVRTALVARAEAGDASARQALLDAFNDREAK